MERDVTSLLSRGATVDDICAGLAYSVAVNYLNRVVRDRRVGKVIYFQGGTAYNDSVAAAFAGILGKPIIVPPHNGVIGAIGMALIARERAKQTGLPSRFRGYNLRNVGFTSRNFTCQACSNLCDMKEFTIDGQKSYWGDKCSNKFRKRTHTDYRPVIPDLIAYRETLFERFLDQGASSGPVIAIPRALSTYDQLPFWATYFRELGCHLKFSSRTDGRIASRGEELAVAQPCFPVQLAHGHVETLLTAGCDFVFVPNVLDRATPTPQVNSHLCPWNQTLPFVLRCAPLLAPLAEKLLSPTVHFRLGEDFVTRELRGLARQLHFTSRQNDRAVRAAFQAQQNFTDALLEEGAKALRTLQATGAPGIVIVGRAYNIYDRGTNCDIPPKLRTLYGVNLLPLDFLPLDGEDISDVHDNMFWHSGRQILAAAKITRRFPNLHWIYLSNFKCGPDSYIKSFLHAASRKPGLFLQFDGHANDAGYLTRCEAYLDSKGMLRCSSATIAA